MDKYSDESDPLKSNQNFIGENKKHTWVKWKGEETYRI